MVPDTFEHVQELNLGQSRPILAGLPGLPGEEVRLLMIPPKDSRAGQVLTVHMAAGFPDNVPATAIPNQGPATGIVEFSAGGANLQRIEFDVPLIRPWGENYSQVGATLRPRRSLYDGVSFPVPAAGLNVLARNDGSLRPVNDATTIIGSTNPIQVSAHLVKLPIASRNNLKKTVYCVVNSGVALAPAALVTIGIPNYAVRARFLRSPLAQALSVTIDGTTIAHGVYTIPVGSVVTSPENRPLEIAPQDQIMVITNAGAANITQMIVVFDLEI